MNFKYIVFLGMLSFFLLTTSCGPTNLLKVKDCQIAEKKLMKVFHQDHPLFGTPDPIYKVTFLKPKDRGLRIKGRICLKTSEADGPNKNVLFTINSPNLIYSKKVLFTNNASHIDFNEPFFLEKRDTINLEIKIIPTGYAVENLTIVKGSIIKLGKREF